MIELVGVAKEYRVRGKVKTVLRDINARIMPGRNLGILGQNGAGKSTSVLEAVFMAVSAAGKI